MNHRKNDLLLIIAAAAGLFLFSELIDQVHPYKAVQFQIDRNDAIEIATLYMKSRGYDLAGYRVSANTEGPFDSFNYLQSQVGLDSTVRLFRHQNNDYLTYYWRVFWFKNLPKSASQESFGAQVSPDGHILQFRHSIPQESAMPEGRSSHLSQEQALQLATDFLNSQGIDLPAYQQEEFSSQKKTLRTDHSFHWSRLQAAVPGKITLTVRVQGDEICEFAQGFEIPQDAALQMKQKQGNYFFILIGSVVLYFVLSMVPLALFLKKYHEGEVGIRTAQAIFLILWSVLMLRAVLAFPIQGVGWQLGELSYDYVSVVKLIFSAFIIFPFMAATAFTSWSVGESMIRGTFADKLHTLDALINRRFSTLKFAQSALRGYGFGAVSMGLTTAVAFFGLKLTGGFTMVTGFDTIITNYLPFLVPVLLAIGSSLSAEILCRLFANVYFLKIVKRRWLAAVLSSAIFALIAFPVWDLLISLEPITLTFLLAFINGLLFSFIFWRYDLLTAMFANYTLIGSLGVLVLMSNPSNSLQRMGWFSLVLLLAPVLLIIRGYLKRESFSYEPDTMPDHIRRITERERMAKELEIARQVQTHLLPKTSPSLPGCDIAGFCLPAKEVGGDYYDFISMDANKLGIAIGDVSGKGVPAAIYMTLTKGVFQSNAEINSSPKAVLTKVNSLLYRTIERGLFVSMFYAIIDMQQKTMTYARAGHNPAIYFSRSGDRFDLLESSGLALGLEKGTVFNEIIKEQQIALQVGDLLVFYTDGFTEAMNKNHHEFSEERLLQVIDHYKDKSSQEIIAAIYQKVRTFVQDYPQHDDMTIVVAKILS